MNNFKPAGWRTGIASLFIVLTVLGDIIYDLSSKSVDEDTETISEAELVVMAGSGLSVIALVLAAIFSLLWFHQSASNLRVFKREKLQFTPGWCVGWWFIPLWNLVKPYEAMKEIWRASDPDSTNEDPDKWRNSTVPGAMKTWWVCFVIGSIVGNASARVQQEPYATWVGLAGSIFMAVAAVLIIWLMRELDRRQERAAKKLLTGHASPITPR
jgi:hypothetical protein